MFVSTYVKLGVEALLLDAPLLGRLEEPLEELPEAAGEDDEEPDDPLLMPLPDEELCAAATPDSANSAAAVATLTNFRFNIG